MNQKLTTKKLKSNILQSISTIFIGLSIVIVLIILYAQQKGYNTSYNEFHTSLHKSINHTLKHTTNNYKFLLKRAVNTTNIKELIINEDRDKLYKKFKKKLDIHQEETKYFEIWHFIDKDGNSLVRVHNKDKFGDNLTQIRPMIKDIVTNHKQISGYESGKHSNAYRIITPIFKDDKYIGSLGIGLNPNYFLEKIGEIINSKGFLFITNNNLKLFSRDSKFSISNYILQSNIDDKDLDILKHLPKNYDFEDNVKIKIEDKNYIVHTHNILGFNKQDYAKYLFIQDITESLNRQNTTLLYISLILILFMLSILVSIRYYLGKFSNELESYHTQHTAELKYIKDRYEIAVNGTQDGLWDWDLVANTIYFSPQWKKQLGYKDDELLNELATREKLIHPDDKEQSIKDYTANMEGKTINYENIHRLKHKNGSWVWILDRGKSIFDEKGKAIRIVGFHTDITKEHNANLEIRKLQSAFERSPVSILMTDKDANITYANPNWCKVTKYSREEVLGKNPRFLKSGNTSDEGYKKLWSDISSGHTWSGDVKNIAKDGSIFWEESTILPSFNTLGEVDGYISFKLEITEKKKIQQQLHEQEEIMIAQSRHAAMGEMISMIAHQWRQPLSIISMGANNILADIELDMLENDILKDGAIEIINQTQELSKTIDDFKNFFRPIKNVEEIYPEDVFTEAFNVIGKSLENNDIEVVEKFNNGNKITTYSRELMQVFINILKNAKEVLIEKDIKNKKIIIHIDEHKDTVNIKICDNAGGIKEDILTKIFDPYFTTKDEHNGTGLGLYMSKTIIEKHLYGRIEAYNKDDGACFNIILPYDVTVEGGKYR